MHLMSRAADYATRTMVHVASAEKGDTPTTQEIAERQGISQVFLQKIVQRLARAGLLRTQRGASGGIALSQPSAEISLRQIVEAMEGPITLNRCLQGPGECFREDVCPVHEVCAKIQSDMLATLESSTLDQLVMRGRELGN